MNIQKERVPVPQQAALEAMMTTDGFAVFKHILVSRRDECLAHASTALLEFSDTENGEHMMSERAQEARMFQAMLKHIDNIASNPESRYTITIQTK